MLKYFHVFKTVRLLLLIIFVNGFLLQSAKAGQRPALKDLDKKITLTFDRVSLKDALDRIAAMGSVGIMYSVSAELTGTYVSIHAKNKPVRDVLNELLAPYPFSYRVIDTKIIVSHDAAKIKSPQRKSPPSGSLPPVVSGRVTDALGSPLPGATIRIKGQNRLTIAGKDGTFAFDEVPTHSVLQVSFIGYLSREIVIPDDGALFTIVLETDNSSLGVVNVVSTGYETLPKERATGSFSQVNNELLNRRVSTGVLSRLEGIVPGLLFNRNTNASASGQTDISIRGTNTLFANNQPLVVLDNFPYDGNIENINPNDIENITVLKDAAAASIWGVQSGNGVIVITTKKGKRDQKLSAEFNANLTVGGKPDLHYSPDFIRSADFINIQQTLFAKGYFDNELSTGYLPVAPAVQIMADERAGVLSPSQATAQINALRNIDVRDQESRYFFRKSVTQQYALNLRGGNSNSDYMVSAGNDHDLSTYRGNKNDRNTFNSVFNFYPVKGLQLSAGFNYIRTAAQTNNPVYNGQLTIGGNPLYPYAQFADSGGNALPVAKDYALSYTGSVDGRYLDWSFRPLDELRNADNTSITTDNRINFNAAYQFLRHFNVSLKYQYEHSILNNQNYYSPDTYFTRNLINEYTQTDGNVSLSYPIPQGGILQQTDARLTSHRGRLQLNYSNNWKNRHELNAIAGAEISDVINETGANTSYGYNRDTETSSAFINYSDYFTISPTGDGLRIPTILGFGKTTDHYLSYFSNAAYSYLGKYTISASGRIDKSNLFGVTTNQKAVPLYSAGMAWNLGKEEFYRVSWLPVIKLRATYGYTGNINKNATAVTTIKNAGNNYYTGGPYAVVANPGNPELRWEKVRIINFGLDFALKNNMISGSLEYYTKKGIDLFGNSPLAPSTGLTAFFGNTADTRGHGFELTVNSKNISGEHFKWTSSFQLSHVTDIVTKYDVTLNSSSYISSGNASTIFPLTGKSLYGLYSYQWMGLSHETGDPLGLLNGQPSSDYAKIIAQTSIEDMRYNGSSRPFVFGSFRNTFSYHALSLSFNLIYKLDYYFRRTSYSSAGLGYSGHIDYYNRWQTPGDESRTDIPSLQFAPYDQNRETFYRNASVLVDKGDHIRLQDISLSYDFDQSKLTGLPFSNLQIYGYVNNVGILWRANKDHLDPDLSTTTTGVMPLPRTVAIGIKAKF